MLSYIKNLYNKVKNKKYSNKDKADYETKQILNDALKNLNELTNEAEVCLKNLENSLETLLIVEKKLKYFNLQKPDNFSQENNKWN